MIMMHRFGKQLCLASVALAALTAAAPALAQTTQTPAEAPARKTYNIAGGPLPQSALALSDQAGVQVVFEAGGAAGVRAGAVRGQLTFEQAMSQLLTGTGLSWRWLRPGVATIEKPAQATAEDGRVLGPVRVEGAQGDYAGAPARGEGVAQLGGVRGGQDQEARGLRPVVAAIASGAPTALEDIPRSVSVLTQQQMQDQDIQTIADAVRRLPGLTLIERPPSGASVYSRGFSVGTMQLDGGAPISLNMIGTGLMDLSAYERVELVRGPNGVFTGLESAGGVLNFVRKRPGGSRVLGVTTTVASFDRYQLGLDYQTPSLLGSAISFRGVANYEDQSFAWNGDHRTNHLLYGLFDAPLGEAARIEVGGSITALKERGRYHGLLRYRDGPLLPVPFNYNFVNDWAYLNSSSKEMFSRIYIRLLEDWNFEFGLDYNRVESDSMDYNMSSTSLLSTTNRVYQQCSGGVCTPVGTNVDIRAYGGSTENLGADLRFTGKFETFGLRHDVFIGADFVNSVPTGSGENDNRITTYPPILTLQDFLGLKTILKPQFEQFSDFDGSNTSSSTLGLTLTDTISWRDRVFLNLSARRQDSESSNFTLQRNAVDGTLYNISLGEENSGLSEMRDAWVPTWSLSVKPLRNMTVYGSYSEGIRDQTRNFTLEGKPLEPSTFENGELGLKYGARNWLFTMAAFRMQQANVGVSIPGSAGKCPPRPGSSCYFVGGASSKSTGIDLQLSGQVTHSVGVDASFNYNDTETVSTHLPIMSQAPTSMGSLLVDWRPDFWPKATFNAAVTYRGRSYQAGTTSIFDPVTEAVVGSVPYEFGQKAYTVFDLGLNYQLSPAVALAFRIENLGDKQYLSTVASGTNSIGLPRSGSVTLRWRPIGVGDRASRSPTTGMAPFGDPADWYGGFDIGGQTPDNWVATSTGPTTVTWTFDTNASPTAHVQLGYHIGPQWRAEFEAGYRATSIASIGGGKVAPLGLCGTSFSVWGVDTTSSCKPPQGDGDVWDLTLNGAYDFGDPTARLRPFIGAGFGLTRASVDFSGRMDGVIDTVYRNYYQQTFGRPFTGIAGGEKLFGEGTTWGANLQLMGGASWRFAKRAELVATYRYTRLADFETKTTNLSNYSITYYGPSQILPGSGMPPLKSFKGDLDSQSLTLGLRWAFGAR
jgi:TonB-dependent siderophore receptor